MINTVPVGPGEFEVYKAGQFRGFVYRKGSKWATDAYRDGRVLQSTFSKRATAVKAVAN